MAATAPPQQQPQQQRSPQQGFSQQGQQQSQNQQPEAIRNLIVNYIPSAIDEGQLRQLFENYGPTESVRIIRDRETKQSRGFGFVKYQCASAAFNAIQYLNGYQVSNKRLKIAYANEAEAAQAQVQMNMYNPMMMGMGMGMGMNMGMGMGMMQQNRPQRGPRNNGYNGQDSQQQQQQQVPAPAQ